MSEGDDRLAVREILEKYPDVPKFIALRIDTSIRGVNLTDAALEAARESNTLFEEVVEGDGGPVRRWNLGGGPTTGAVLRDGSGLGGLEWVINGDFGSFVRDGEPYTIDVVDDKLTLLDNGEPVEEVFFVPKPEYYGKKTSRGTPMHRVVIAGPPDCLTIPLYHYCDFWRQKLPCKYCSYQAHQVLRREKSEAELEDIYETVSEALKEQGRWTAIRLVSGSDPGGATPYKNEADEYVRVLKTLARCFGSKWMPVRLVASAFPKEQLVRLAEAGATAYEAHIEVWDKKIWEWVCPGKAKWFGRDYWIEKPIEAVGIFGRGNVCTQLVAGAELVQPYGFKTIDEALQSSLEGARFFAEHGVTTTATMLWVEKGSMLYKSEHTPASLEYLVRLARGLRDIRRAHRIGVDYNDYRRCGQHPDTDLSRLDYQEVLP